MKGATKRLLFIHAHPDDETIATGISLAHFARAGHDVHVLTCTLGEEGEVIPPELAHLEGTTGDELARHRLGELTAACEVLGVTSHVLGQGEGRLHNGLSTYRDSGMAGSASAADPRSFIQAEISVAADQVRGVLNALSPDIVVTYDQGGGYRHPDHIRTHRVTCAAVAGMPRRIPLFAVFTPESWVFEDRAWLASPRTRDCWAAPGRDDELEVSEVADSIVTHETVDRDVIQVQKEALAMHRTQVSVQGDVFALSNNIAHRLSGREGFALLDPHTGAPTGHHATGERRRGLLEDCP